MPTSTLTSKGQVTIPKAIRERLHLEPGDRLVFRLEGSCRFVVEVEASPRAGRLPGLLRHLAGNGAPSIEAMDDAIRHHLGRKHGGPVER